MRKRQTVMMQLMLRIIPLVAVLMIAVNVFTIRLITTTIQGMTETQLKKEAYGNTAILNKAISEDISSLIPVKETLEHFHFNSDNERLAYLETTTSINDSIPNGVYMGDAKNNYLDGSLWVPDAGYKVVERDWYKEGINHDSFALGTPYQDANTGQMIVSISSKINVKGWSDAVIVGDMFLDQISEFISDLTIMDVGYSFIIYPDDSLIVAHKNTQYNGLSFAEAGKTDDIIAYLETHANDRTFLDNVITVDNQGTEYMIVAETVEGTDWYLMCCVPEAVVMDTLMNLIKSVSAIAIVLSIIVIIIIALTINKQMKPISKLTNVIESITGGDFTIDVEVNGNNEITTMSEKLEAFITNMRGIIRQLTGISLQLGEQASNSADISNVLSDTSTTQSEAMGQLNMTVDDLAHSIENVAENANSLSDAVNIVLTNGEDAEDKVTEAVSAAEKGKTDIEKVAENMDKINESIEILSNTVQEVGASTEEINKITDIIGDIAGQTNLLSLNASIEAARAGEAGKGFAVVADQIGKLASMSADSVKHINQLIEQISRQVTSTVIQTEQSVEDIKESKELVDVSYQTFMDIYENVMQTNTNIKNVTSKIREAGDVATSMAAITQEQSASTEEILATSESLYAQSKDIATNSNKIASMAEELETTASTIKDSIQQFKS